MNAKGIRMALGVATLSLVQSTAMAVVLYENTFDADLPGLGIRPNGVWGWQAPEDGTVVFTWEVTENGGVGGSQSYRETTDSTGAFGTSWFFARGFGQFAIHANESSPLAGGVEGSNNPARYRFSIDVKVEGNDGWEPTTPLHFGVSAIDNEYETKYGIDVNGDGILEGGAAVYEVEVNPVIPVSGEYVTVSFTLNQGVKEVNPNILPEHRVFSNGLSLQWYMFYNTAGFGFDDNNVLNIDNARIEFLDTLPSIPGDHNGDGLVDASDYVLWRKDPSSHDNEQGYTDWRANFGAGGGGGSAMALAGVPEPASAALFITALAWGLLHFPYRRRTAA